MQFIFAFYVEKEDVVFESVTESLPCLADASENDFVALTAGTSECEQLAAARHVKAVRWPRP